MIPTVFRTSFLTLKSVTLGRLVTNAADPGQDFWPKSSSSVRPTDVDVQSFKDVYKLFGVQKTGAFRSKLTQFVSGNVASQRASLEKLATDEWTVYSLLQQTDYFERICKDDAAKEWMERMLKHCPLFLVVGLITVKDAAIIQKHHQSAQVGASLDVPVLDVLTSGITTMVPLGGDGSKIGASALRARQTEDFSSFFVPGERVIGIKYRKLKFGMLSSKNIESVRMDNSQRWKLFDGGDRALSDDIIEADLESSMNAEDLELEEEIDVITVDEEEFVFIEE